MSEWAVAPLGDLYGEPSRNGVTIAKDTRGVGVPMVNMRELFANERIQGQYSELVPVTDRQLAQFGLDDQDLLFGRRSLVRDGAGKVSIVWQPPHRAVFESSLIRVRLDSMKASPLFYFYLFSSVVGREIMETIIEQVAVAGIRSSDLANVEVPVPPLDEQRRIAAVLGSLDDLIDADRAQAERLVLSARAAYDQLQSHAWPLVAFDSTVEVISGGTPKTGVGEYWGGAIPWYSVADAPSGGSPWVTTTAKSITEAGVANSVTRVLPAGTTILSARGTVGKLALVGVPMAMNQSCYGLRSTSGDKGVFGYFAAQDVVRDLQTMANGSVFDTITRDTLTQVRVSLPPAQEVAVFEAQAWPMFDMARSLQEEIADLTSTRDDLLPLVMSGRLRVRAENRQG